jgi:integral membrane sensor domain MASE1
VVLFLLSAAESLADWFASVIDGDVFIGCIIGAIIAVVVLSIIKPDKFN